LETPQDLISTTPASEPNAPVTWADRGNAIGGPLGNRSFNREAA
jgi:hypothetical protein